VAFSVSKLETAWTTKNKPTTDVIEFSKIADMKKLTWLAAVLITGSALTFMACDKDDAIESGITYSELPQAGKTMIESHFGANTVASVTRKNNTDTDGSLYEVRLNSGIEIDLDKDGNWTDIDGNHQRLPDALIPAPILSYVVKQYPAPLFIEGIDKEPYGYQIDLSNDLDLKFNADGNFIGLD